MTNGSALQQEMTRKQAELTVIRRELDDIQRQLAASGPGNGSASDLRRRITELESRRVRTSREIEAIRQMAASFNEPLDEAPSASQGSRTDAATPHRQPVPEG